MEKSEITAVQKQYRQGFAFGMSPVFVDFEDSLDCGKNFRSISFMNGYNDGRSAYIRLNGDLINGIPEVLLTPNLIEEFYTLGQIGLSLDLQNKFSDFQMSVIQSFYQRGSSQQNHAWNFEVKNLLQSLGIDYQI